MIPLTDYVPVSGEAYFHGRYFLYSRLTVSKFTAGMSLVDSLDSVLMLYAYASPSTTSKEGKLALFYRSVPGQSKPPVNLSIEGQPGSEQMFIPAIEVIPLRSGNEDVEHSAICVEAEMSQSEEEGKSFQPELQPEDQGGVIEPVGRAREIVETKTEVMSGLSITLTVLSIVVALR